MAPKIVPISKRPLESYDYDHVMSREKKIIVEELISEYNRAQKLVDEVRTLQHKIVAVGQATKSEAPQGKTETEKESVTRLNQVVNSVVEKLGQVKFTEIELLYEPSYST